MDEMVMEKLDKVIAGLRCCSIPDCRECPYNGLECVRRLPEDALKMIEDLKILVTAAGVLERYRTAFEALAKGEE